LVNNQSNHYFNFEDDFIKDLRCIPLCVRRKLDLIGIKLKLTHWQDFNLIEKNKIVDWPDSKNDLIDLKTFLKEITSNSKYGEAKVAISNPYISYQTSPSGPYNYYHILHYESTDLV